MNRNKHYISFLMLLAAMTLGMLASCYSNNCPLSSVVTCNYCFYDAEGTAIKYSDTITVTTLKPGWNTVYIYRQLGSPTVERKQRDSVLLSQGFAETVTQRRNDTILVNKACNTSKIEVPMSYFNEEDTIIFSYSRISLKDTIKIKHSSYAHVELPECGTFRYHNLRSVTSTDAAIDHIEISNPKVDYEGRENIKIFFNGVVEK